MKRYGFILLILGLLACQLPSASEEEKQWSFTSIASPSSSRSSDFLIMKNAGDQVFFAWTNLNEQTIRLRAHC
jgi:hypothetical protein